MLFSHDVVRLRVHPSCADRDNVPRYAFSCDALLRIKQKLFQENSWAKKSSVHF